MSAQANRIASDFQSFLLNKYSTLRYMKAYFYAYESLGIDEFELFSTSILLFEPEIDSLLFVLQVDRDKYYNYREHYLKKYNKEVIALDTEKDQRPAFYPIHFLKSFNQTNLVAGNDISSNSNVYNALRTTFIDTEPKIAFLNSENLSENTDGYIIDPLFSIDPQSGKIRNRIDASKYKANHGFIFMGLNVGKFFDTQQEALDDALCLDLGYEEKANYKLIFRSHDCAQQLDAESYDIYFPLFGIDWHLKFVPRKSHYVEFIWQKYFVLYGGIVFTLLLASYFYMILWQREQDRQAQRKLNEEIAKKEQLNLQMQDYTDKLELARLQQMDIYRSLQEEKLKAEQANRTKSDFLANMSHELRTPLNSILGITKIVKEEITGNQELEEMLDILDSSSTALLEIVNDILDLSKIEAGKVQLESIDFNVQEVVHNVTASLQNVADRKGLYLRTKFGKDSFPMLKGDPLRLSRVFMNLIGNAVKYSVEGGVTIIVSYEEKDESSIILSCSVSDTGIGISKERIDHIFDKFTQADETTTRTFGGTGLGLTITQDLLEMMGGNVAVESVEGVGSTFSFIVPIRISEVQDTQQEAEKVISDIEITDDDRQKLTEKQVLVVEDNEFNVVLIKKFLKKVGFVNIECANDGAEGIKKYQEGAYDMILMDCHMPIKSGYEATEEIRKLEVSAEIENKVPIIALTADAMVGVKERCLEAGMNDYLSKPVDYKDLVKMIHKWLRL